MIRQIQLDPSRNFEHLGELLRDKGEWCFLSARVYVQRGAHRNSLVLGSLSESLGHHWGFILVLSVMEVDNME